MGLGDRRMSLCQAVSAHGKPSSACRRAIEFYHAFQIKWRMRVFGVSACKAAVGMSVRAQERSRLSSSSIAVPPAPTRVSFCCGAGSVGLDAIADSLNAKGIHAEVAGHLQWRAAAEEILRERAGGKTDAIVLVGHSQGANNVIDMARVLEAQNVPVALLVTLAPYRQDPVPANVMRAINYYQSAGWGSSAYGGTWFPGQAVECRCRGGLDCFPHQHRQERPHPSRNRPRDRGGRQGQVKWTQSIAGRASA
jgi:hypothetical protein